MGQSEGEAIGGAWGETEAMHADLGDPRRNATLAMMMDGLAARPAGSVLKAFPVASEAKAVYRFLENDAVNPQDILAGHFAATRERLVGVPFVLAVQDTTTFCFSGLKKTAGLGLVGATNALGMLLHSSLAVSLDGTPLGLLAAKMWARPVDGVRSRKTDKKRRNGQPTESERWIELLKESEAALPASTQVVAVADREADIYEFLQEAAALQQHFVVRACRNRVLVDETDNLFNLATTLPVRAKFDLKVPRAHERSARTAHIHLRYSHLELRAPLDRKRAEDLPPLSLTFVCATEHDAPAGEDPIDWMILTSFEVKTKEDARAVLQIYTLRWRIERFHYTLKTGGLEFERLQLETEERLERALAVYCIAAWRIQSLMYESRANPEQSCEGFLTKTEWEAVCVYKHRRIPTKPPTLGEAIRWIASMGGFLGRKGDGHPGVKVLWRGFVRLHDIMRGIELARELVGKE